MENKTITAIVPYLKSGDPEGFMIKLRSLLIEAKVPIKTVADFYNTLITFLYLVSIPIKGQPNAISVSGQADIIICIDKYYYLLKLSTDGDAEETYTQIDDNRYAYLYGVENKKVFKIGIDYSIIRQRIEDWRIG